MRRLFLFAVWLQLSAQEYYPPEYHEFLESQGLDFTEKSLGLTLKEPEPKIFNRDDWLWAEENDAAAQRNTEALFFVLQNDMLRAREILEEIVDKSPHFFPARYNLGRVYLYYHLYKKAHIQFTFAQRLVPGYARNYYYLGKCYEGLGDPNSARHHYLLAYRHNPYDLSSLVAIGDMLYEKKDYSEASTIYQRALKYDDGYNDALTGMGKIDLAHGRYYSATLWFRSVNTANPYKREYHYYYGEAAFLARLYKLAGEQYSSILGYPQDAIFDKVSLSRIRLRLEQARRLSLQNTENE